jgi:hypothetical protein
MLIRDDYQKDAHSQTIITNWTARQIQCYTRAIHYELLDRM